MPKSATTLVRAGQTRSQHGEHSEAMYLTQGYAYESPEAAEARFQGEDEGFIYSRYGNPTVTMLEKRLAAYEGAEDCFAVSSGMSAAFAALACQLEAGDHVVSAKALFSSCFYILNSILPKWGVEVTFVEGSDLKAWESATKPNTKLFFAETLSNPRLELIDIKGISTIAKNNNIKLVLDNVFATPVLINAFELGADIVFYSATKHIDGQGRILGGVILGDEEFIRGPLQDFCRHTGPTLSAFNAWILLKSLETLELRVERQSENALKIAQALEAHPKTEAVIYPGLSNHPNFELGKKTLSSGGTMIAFEVKGEKEDAFKFLNNLNIITLSNNLGDTKTMITHPSTTTHFKLTVEEKLEMNIGDNLIRLSVGIENQKDLINDIYKALDSI